MKRAHRFNWMALFAFAIQFTCFGAERNGLLPKFESCDPVSDQSENISNIKIPPSSSKASAGSDFDLHSADLSFCSDWNPEFAHNGYHCCANNTFSRKRRGARCSPSRAKASYCDEMTKEQKEYSDAVVSGKVKNVLAVITHDLDRKGGQAFCTVNNGFLAWGRPIIPTPENRILLRAPLRCTHFGTDRMVGMLEWVGREIRKEYSSGTYAGVRLLIGDVSAPRGGCLSGKSGRKGHASHTTGQDADVGYLTIKPGGESPDHFHAQFSPQENWWLIKKILKNPIACVRVIFLDRKHIKKLEKSAKTDPDWALYRRFIRHMPRHKNHMHVRIGDASGQSGCVRDAHPELEFEEDGDPSSDSSELLDIEE